ncbi:MarC family protein [Spirochaetia bacterium 38H-sp]|uniref:UPF0056 membrane protein n=1 Tax=Rarispira pelagica TaxID=3141764 RepID=A0ABU9UC31_9SPIR
MDIIATMITLILIMDPFGNIPTFLSLLKEYPAKKRQIIIVREMLIALIILLAFLYLGEHILGAMHIKRQALGISGGIVLLMISIKMVFPTGKEQEALRQEPLIVPLAMPLIAGPSAIAMLTLLASQYPGQKTRLAISLAGAWAVSLIILLSAGIIKKLLGKQGIAAVERLMGMLLIAMSIQMLLDGLLSYLTPLL